MEVLIAGGAGFLGSWLCEEMHKKGNYVVCVDDFSSGKWENIKYLQGNFEVVCTDISKNFKGVLDFLDDKIDLIFNLASPAAPFQYQEIPVQTMLANSLGSLNLIKLAGENDCPIVFASTSEVYGNAEVVPTPESYWGKVNPVGIRSCYDESKRFAEALFKAHEREHGTDVRIVRIFNTYGPKMRSDGSYGRAVPNFITQCLRGDQITIYGDGTQTRSFCYVSDTVGAIAEIGTNEKARGEIFNVGNPNEITILELADMIKQITGSNSVRTFLPLPEDDPRRRCPDISKIRKVLGWEPKIPLEQGLKKTIEWFAQNKRWR